jgi:hypothetical protein
MNEAGVLTLSKLLATAAFALSVWAPGAAFSQELGTGSYCGAYRVGHVNGVRTSQSDANRSLDRLKETFGPQFRNSNVGYFLAYNPTGGLPTDVAEVLAQKSVEFPGATIVQMLRYLLINVSGTLPSQLVNELATYWAGWVNGNRSSYNTFEDVALRGIVDVVRAQALPTQRVLLVPHSQGNLYANRVVEIITTEIAPGWNRVVSEKSIGILGVATPAAYVAGQRSSHKMYLTSSNDLIINGLRNGVPPLTPPSTVLAPNITIDLSSSDPSGHGFRETYLGTDSGAAAIQGGMHAILTALLSTVPSSDSALALFSADYRPASPLQPRMARTGQWFTSPFISYSDEELRAVAREGDLTQAEMAATSLARNCIQRELVALMRGEAAQPPNPADRLGACNLNDEDGWRGFLNLIARHDEVSLSVDVWSYSLGGAADVYVIGECRRT